MIKCLAITTIHHGDDNGRAYYLLPQKIRDKDTLDLLFSDLDQNGDREIDFQEFIPLIAMVTSACHGLFMTEQNH